MTPPERWALPDLEAAAARCRERNAAGIRCILSPLGEYAADEAAADRAGEAYRAAMGAIAAEGLDASVAVKLSALGAAAGLAHWGDRLGLIVDEGRRRHVGIEIDMEGAAMVGPAIAAAEEAAASGAPSGLAVQAYLNRSAADLPRILRAGITPRLVKGAYIGDTGDFSDIQRRFLDLAAAALESGRPFSVGTHDPDLIGWIVGTADRRLIECGFLMGLADDTKVRMAREGWRVAEYIPFGEERAAYEGRRWRYLRSIEALGRSPVL
ncbi:Proline dehydrogenase [Methanofollis liminatans DSM 4140]|uniref:Proline dehydrogenase n=1 Tax=Methanofollis liminatans DSM 4140 TaxID=28892 RepID=J0S016_9EURY|nr:proline dehydrogenase family protein [Methanofollis liminatans]EJG07186.1 Proline dehydrogenase [Methanofollis liminatans DSM 4140]